jgi:simple sugar transport system ATP-binding protein
MSAGTHPDAGGEPVPAPSAGEPPILEARDIVKTFGHVHALRDANFSAHAGEVVALIGDNGAGSPQ